MSTTATVRPEPLPVLPDEFFPAVDIDFDGLSPLHTAQQAAALMYALAGYPVFPCHEVDLATGACSCRLGLECPEKNRGKHPRTVHGFKDATANLVQVRAWWTKWPNANIAIPTGPGTGLHVVDPDHADGLAELETLPPTNALAISQTGGGGEHHFTEWTAGRNTTKSEDGPLHHIDSRGEGGYVIVPPSRNFFGRYEWVKPLVRLDDDAPRKVRLAPLSQEWLNLLTLAEKETGGRKPPTGPGRSIPEGRRNATLASLAGTMRRRGMTLTEIEAALLVVNAERCNPPLSESEVRKIAGSIGSYPPEGTPGGTEPLIKLVAGAYSADPPPLVCPYVLEAGHTILFAPPDSFKTWLALLLAVSIDAGVSALWPVKQQRVLFLNLERSEEIFARRLARVNRVLGLPDNRPLLSVHARGQKLARIEAQLSAEMAQYKIDGIVLDSMSRAGEGSMVDDQNANAILDMVFRLAPSWSLALAHTPRNDATHVFGSQMFDAGADLVVRAVPNEAHTGVGLTMTKSNDAPRPERPDILAVTFDRGGLQAVRQAGAGEFKDIEAGLGAISTRAAEERIVEALRAADAPLTYKDLTARTGLAHATLSENLGGGDETHLPMKPLYITGKVTREKSGKAWVFSAGWNQVSEGPPTLADTSDT